MRGSRNFFRGVHARRSEMDNVFIFCPQLILQFIEGVQWFDYRENYTFPSIQKGSNIFQGGGVQLFPGGGGGGGGGPNHLIIIFKETHITCDFLGGPVPTPPPPPPGSVHAKLQFRSVLSHVILERRPSPVRVSPYSH